MSSGSIFLVNENGELARMRPSAPATEDRMQMLVAKYPELISDGDGELLLIKREQAVGDSVEGGGRWSLDHLFVTRGAIPVLVELKRASDTRLRREIVGQMLDYAANAVAYWRAGLIATTFTNTCSILNQDADDVLANFIGDRDPIGFWNEVDANIQNGKLRLVFVADVILRELIQIVEFLNDQMKADVRAVELKWFEGDNGVTTLLPRSFGQTEIATARKSASRPLAGMQIDEWIEKNVVPHGEDAVLGTRAYIEVVQSLGARARVAPTHGSIVAEFNGDDGKPYYPFHLWKHGLRVSISFEYIWKRKGLEGESLRQSILTRFNSEVGVMKPSNLKGFPGFKVGCLCNEEIRNRFAAAASDVISKAKVA